jgi:transposase-like protein
MIEGKSLAKTAELCGVHATTAFRWRHRFLRASADEEPRMQSGIVEADETFHSRILQGQVAGGSLPPRICRAISDGTAPSKASGRQRAPR